ncbi:MAG: alanine racemase [Candidatus Dormibacteraceae bacterium]
MTATLARWAEVDLAALKGNVGHLRARLPPQTQVIAVVKANGYAHGAREVAGAALEAGATMLAVSTPAEAVELRGICPPGQVLALGGLAPQTVFEAVDAGCAVVCSSPELADAVAAAVPPGEVRDVHLKIDTGMHRLGCHPDAAPGLARRIARNPRLRLAGTMTHFASSECDESMTHEQFRRFGVALERFDVAPGLRHAANTQGALRHPEMALDAVRFGIGMYGCEWSELRPVLSLHALVTHVLDVIPGGRVGYGGTWRAERPSRIATVSIGYADGVFRARSSRGSVVVRGRRAPLIGRVSMDMLALDVTDIPGVRPGDVATLIGRGISAEEVAEWSGTSSYEVLLAIGARVRRRYKE